MLLYSRIISGIIFFTVLFAQIDKGKEPSRFVPKKYNDGFILEPVKNQNRINSDEIRHSPGYNNRFNYSRNYRSEDDIIIEPGISIPARQYNSNRSVEDTLAYYPPGGWGGQFIMSPGDAMWTVFQMPADGILKGVNVPVYEWGTGDQQLTVSLHKMSYPYASYGTMYPPSAVDGAGWIGGYDMDDTTGYMSIEGTTYTTGGTEGICDTNDVVVAGARDPLGTEPAVSGPPGTPLMGLLWPYGFTTATMDPTMNPDFAIGGNVVNWIYTTPFGPEVYFLQGDWIGILVASTGAGGGDDDATGFFYAAGAGVVDPWVSGKFYGGCTGISGNGGWHIRSWIFNFQLAVELTGDRGPVFESYDHLITTLSTENRTVTAHISDDNPSGGDAGVTAAQILYQIDSLTAPLNTINMILISGDNENGVWEGDIPGQEPWTSIYYQYRAVDVNGNTTLTEQQSYIIFEPSSNELVFYNQEIENIFYPPPEGMVSFYLYSGNSIFDIWPASNGPLTDELLQHYDVLIELAGGDGPIYNNDAEVTQWWDGDKTYIVAGDEWLGQRCYGWGNDCYGVPRDILGITYAYHDINGRSSGDWEGISRLIPDSAGVTSDLFEFLSDSLLLNYDPDYETGNNNWLDGFEVVDGYTVDMTAYSGVLDSNGNIANDAELYNVMVHGQAGNGGKSAFLGFDPIALNTTPSYYWVGASSYWNTINPNCPPNASPLVSVYEALQGIVSVEDEIEQPTTFSLKGNYPNPFNPVTNIHYELHMDTRVKITIYDILGREVRKLVSGELVSGYHKEIWDGTNDLGKRVSAGVYLYKVEAGEFVQTRKMILLK